MYTKSGLTKKDLCLNKSGRLMTKKQLAHGKKAFKGGLRKWCNAVEEARKELGIEGFCAIKKGSKFYKRAREIYDA